MTKRFFASIMALALVAVFVGVGVNAAPTANVSATVTAQLVSVSVSNGTVAYGTLALNTVKDTTTNGVNNTQVATNDSNVSVNLGIRSSDAVSSGTHWDLAASASSDAFTHDFCTTTCDASPVWVAFAVDNSTYSTLANTVVVSGTTDFDLRVGTPTVSTDSELHTVTVTVQATAL